mgnify:CR=1 FL=1
MKKDIFCYVLLNIRLKTLIYGRVNMKYDFVIVGGGSAGCVLANRLSEDDRYQVCLLEAGGHNKHPLVSTPVALAGLMTSKKFNWLYESAVESSQQNQKIFCPRGKGLGGSSAINAMVYIRGHDTDYDRWAYEEGAKGWSAKEVLPYFKKSQYQERGECERHGTEGELNVSDALKHYPFNDLFIEAAQQLGHAVNEDFNGEQQEGVGYYQYSIKNGKRHCTAEAFLRPIESRSNLKIITGAHACGIEFDANKAVAVTYLDDQGSKFRVQATREVILSGGAFNSPQLLMLSGIGPTEELEKHGIHVKHELPGVGKNLQEHVEAIVVRSAAKGKKSPFALKPGFMIKQIPSILGFPLTKKGFLGGNPIEAGGFFRSTEAKKIPDMQWIFLPNKMNDHGRDMKILQSYGYSSHVCLLRPKSRGSVKLNSSDPIAAPKINLNMLSHPDDVKDLIKGVKKTRELLTADAFKEYLSDEVFPGEGCQSDEALEEFLRRKAVQVHHPVGTCKMGVDAMAVVDPELRVHGLKNIRVVDASVMPSLIGGNTNAPAIMIAEKASAMILAAHKDRF